MKTRTKNTGKTRAPRKATRGSRSRRTLDVDYLDALRCSPVELELAGQLKLWGDKRVRRIEPPA